MIEQWDTILVIAAGEPWAAEHRKIRDNLAALTLKALDQTETLEDLKPAAVATNAQPTAGDYTIHLESAETQSSVQSSWAELKAAYPTQLANKSLVVKQIDLGDQGTFNRILAAPFANSGDAQKTCSELKGLGQYCTVLSLK